MEQPSPPQSEEMAEIQGVDFSMYHVYKPRRGMKRGEESKETYKLPHRLIEKKRRDRINECISQLKDLLPENLKLTTLGHLEKAVVLELTLKHVNGLTSLLEQQQQKILALQSGMQSGMQSDQPPAASQEQTEEMFRSGFHLCAKEVLAYLANQQSDGDRLAPPHHLVDHIQALAAEVLQGAARCPTRTPPTSTPPAEEEEEEVVPAPHHHHNHHHHHHHHQSHKDKPVAQAGPKPSGEGGYGRNCVPVIQRTFAAAAGSTGEQSGSDTDTDSGYGGELEKRAHHDYYYYHHHHHGQESQLKRALAERRGSSHFKQEEGGDEPRRKRARSSESSEDGSLSGGESSSSSSSSESPSAQRPYVSASPDHPPHLSPLCMPFYLLPPSAAAYLPMLEKVWYPGGVPMLHPGMGAGHHGSSSSTANSDRSAHHHPPPPPPPQLMMSPGEGRGCSPAPPPMDSSPALLQALQQAPPINLETKD